MSHRVKVGNILQVSQVLLSHGIAPAALLEGVGLPPAVLLDGEAWIDREASFRLSEEAERALNDIHFGLHVSDLQKIEQFGELGAGILRAPSIGRALSVACREARAVVGGLSTGIVEDESFRGERCIRLWFEFQGRLGFDPRHHVEANLLFFRKIFDLVAEPVSVLYRLPWVKPRDTAELERLLGPDLEFGAERAELVFGCATMRLPVRYSPPTLVHGCTPSTARETGGAVMRVLRDTIVQERPTAAGIADELGMNVRTMQRHLSTWGLTFEMLLDEYRYRRAMEFLQKGQYSITEIAFLLGYSDSAHFTRAFRRWSGHAPRQYASSLREATCRSVALA